MSHRQTHISFMKRVLVNFHSLLLQGCQILLPKWWWTAQDNATQQILWGIRWTQSGTNIMICKSTGGLWSSVTCLLYAMHVELCMRSHTTWNVKQKCSFLVLLSSMSLWNCCDKCFKNVDCVASLLCAQTPIYKAFELFSLSLVYITSCGVRF